MQQRKVLMLALIMMLIGSPLLMSSTLALNQPSEITVDEFIGSCPTAEELDEIDAVISLRFDLDLSGEPLVCTAAEGSRDLTGLEERAYQALRVMRDIEFNLPLPWTESGLFDWLTEAITAIRFRSDIQLSFCCEPFGVINIQTNNLAALSTERWVNPQSGAGLEGLVLLFAHEARHNQFRPHTCNAGDNTLAEEGAWAIQYQLGMWFATQTGSFIDSDSPYRSYYRETALYNAEQVRDVRICRNPEADLALQISAPESIAADDPLTYTYTISNNGPGSAANSILYVEAPDNTSFQSVSEEADCTTPEPGSSGGITCQLGAIRAGESVELSISFAVESSSITSVSNKPGFSSPWATSSAKDLNRDNNTQEVRVQIDR